MSTTIDVRPLLREALRYAGITQAEVARRMGVSPPVVSRLLNKPGANVELGTLVSFALACGMRLNLDVRERIDWNTQPAPPAFDVFGLAA